MSWHRGSWGFFLLPLLLVPWIILKTYSGEERLAMTGLFVHGLPVMIVTGLGLGWPAWLNMRSLRALPLSSASLAAIFFSVPLVAGVIVGLFMLVAGLLGLLAASPMQACLEGMAATGLGALAFTTALGLSSPRVQVPVYMVLIAMAFGHAAGMVLGPPWVHALLAVVDLLLIPLSFMVILGSIRQSSTLYLPRGFGDHKMMASPR